MATRRPLVMIDGVRQQLPDTDRLPLKTINGNELTGTGDITVSSSIISSQLSQPLTLPAGTSMTIVGTLIVDTILTIDGMLGVI